MFVLGLMGTCALKGIALMFPCAESWLFERRGLGGPTSRVLLPPLGLRLLCTLLSRTLPVALSQKLPFVEESPLNMLLSHTLALCCEYREHDPFADKVRLGAANWRIGRAVAVGGELRGDNDVRGDSSGDVWPAGEGQCPGTGDRRDTGPFALGVFPAASPTMYFIFKEETHASMKKMILIFVKKYLLSLMSCQDKCRYRELTQALVL